MTAAEHADAIPPVLPPLPGERPQWRRCLPPSLALSWLAAGWRDFAARPGPSAGYGVFLFALSMATICGLALLGYEQLLFPALAGFLVIGPLLAAGLYEKSRRIAAGEPVTLAGMVLVRPRSGGQLTFAGLLLCLLMLLWMRSAVLLYALFFGLLPYPGFESTALLLLTTPGGWALLVVGSLVGGLFAAFAFAVSVFSIPMLLNERSDAFTAMGTSMALVWGNMPLMLTWGAIVVALFAFCVATALIGLIVVFPVLGHATWHAYRAMREPAGACR